MIPFIFFSTSVVVVGLLYGTLLSHFCKWLSYCPVTSLYQSIYSCNPKKHPGNIATYLYLVSSPKTKRSDIQKLYTAIKQVFHFAAATLST